MSAARHEGRSVLYYGCVGCGVLVGILVLAAAGVAGLAWMQVRGERVEQVELSQEVADLPPSVPAPESRSADEPVTLDGPSVGTDGQARAAGRVVLDVRSAEFRVRAGERGAPVRVRARYDAAAYELTEEESIAEDGTWQYTVSFRRTANVVLTMVKELLGGTSPEIVVELPRDVPLALEATAVRGGLEAELGGLWLVELDLDGRQGGFVLDAGTPAPRPVERMAIRASMGGLVAGHVGNLSPRRLTVDVDMGGGVVDLRGAWAADADIAIANRRGGVQLIVPDELVTRGLEGIEPGEGPAPPAPDAEIPGPVLSFELSGDLDDIKVQRR